MLLSVVIVNIFSEGGCVKYTCCANADCDDGSSDTVDRCILPSSKDARCSNTLIDDLILPQNQNTNPTSEITQETTPENPEIQESTDNNTDTPTTDVISGSPCETTIDCDDSDLSTKDMCVGSPDKVCLNLKITTCLPGDGYCPDTCTTATDTDC
jgi:hypothetical protein